MRQAGRDFLITSNVLHARWWALKIEVRNLADPTTSYPRAMPHELSAQIESMPLTQTRSHPRVSRHSCPMMQHEPPVELMPQPRLVARRTPADELPRYPRLSPLRTQGHVQVRYLEHRTKRPQSRASTLDLTCGSARKTGSAHQEQFRRGGTGKTIPMARGYR